MKKYLIIVMLSAVLCSSIVGGEPAATPTTQGPSDVELLARAARWGDIKEVKRLIENGADPNGRPSNWNVPPYAWVVNWSAPLHLTRSPEVVRYLLSLSRTDPNIETLEGETPLHRAAKNYALEAKAELLKHERVRVDGKDMFKKTSLLCLLEAHCPLSRSLSLEEDVKAEEVVRSLLKKGADPQARGRDGQSPLSTALLIPQCGGTVRLQRVLLDHVAKIAEIKAEMDGRSALY